MGNIGLIVLVVVFVGGLSALLMWYQACKKAEVWQGTVIKIKHKTIDKSASDEPAQLEDYVYVYYRKDDGKKGKLSLRKHAFNQQFPGLQVNDRLNKIAGEYYPHKV